MMDQFNDIMKPLLKHSGLDFEVRNDRDILSRETVVCISKMLTITDFDLRRTDVKPYEKFFELFEEQVCTGIKNSPMIKAIVKPLEDDIKSKDDQIAKYRKTIARLRKFENHYQIQMQLNHGNGADREQRANS